MSAEEEHAETTPLIPEEGKPRAAQAEEDGIHRDKENLLFSILCCPVRMAVALAACLLTCVCCPLMFCCELGIIAFLRCCCDPSLETMEAIFGRPLWELVLVRAQKLDKQVHAACTAVFSRPDFDDAAMRLFREVDKDNSGVVDAGELDQLIDRIPANVALTKADVEDITTLYKDYTGSKTKLTPKDWPIFIRAVLALIIANAILIHRMDRAEIIIIGFTADGRTAKDASADQA